MLPSEAPQPQAEGLSAPPAETGESGQETAAAVVEEGMQVNRFTQQGMQMSKRRVGSYADAIEWIALNDDTEWLDDESGSPSVTLCLVADVFGRSTEQATADLRRAVKRASK